jgi:hypothetical protein
MGEVVCKRTWKRGKVLSYSDELAGGVLEILQEGEGVEEEMRKWKLKPCAPIDGS